MPTRSRELILLPRAIDRGQQVIGTRQFDVRIFAKTQNYYRMVRIESVKYSPSWAKVELRQTYQGLDVFTVSGANGEIPFTIDIYNNEPVDIALFNNSMDTEVRFSIDFVGWQEGEG